MKKCMVVIMMCLAALNAGAESLRSALYPTDWTPEYTDGEGRFLHDFSYSGYHNGEMNLPPNTGGTIFDVVAGYGADNTGAEDATGAIQAAIAAAEGAGGGWYISRRVCIGATEGCMCRNRT